jgi:hypothetical protein
MKAGHGDLGRFAKVWSGSPQVSKGHVTFPVSKGQERYSMLETPILSWWGETQQCSFSSLGPLFSAK